MIEAAAKVKIGKDQVTVTVCRRTLRDAPGLEPLVLSNEHAHHVIATDMTRSRGVLRFKVEGRAQQPQPGDKTLISHR